MVATSHISLYVSERTMHKECIKIALQCNPMNLVFGAANFNSINLSHPKSYNKFISLNNIGYDFFAYCQRHTNNVYTDGFDSCSFLPNDITPKTTSSTFYNSYQKIQNGVKHFTTIFTHTESTTTKKCCRN